MCSSEVFLLWVHLCQGDTQLLDLHIPVQVTHAFDGEEAYSTILERGGPDAFDVILMDLHMPRKVSALRHYTLQPFHLQGTVR